MAKVKAVKAIKDKKRPAGEIIADAVKWIDAIELKTSAAGLNTADLKHVLDLLRPLIPAPAAPKTRTIEQLTELLAHGLRRFNPAEPISAIEAEKHACILCRRPFGFARLSYFWSPAKHERGYMHLGCYDRRMAELWTRFDRPRDSSFDPTSAAVCLCGHGFGAHRADDSHGGIDYIECQSSFSVPGRDESGRGKSVKCDCDHFRPGGQIIDDDDRVKAWMAEHPEIAAANAASAAEVAGDNSIRGQINRAIDNAGKVCKFCDAGDPTSIEPYHRPEDCPAMTPADRAELARINHDMAEAEDIEAFGREALED